MRTLIANFYAIRAELRRIFVAGVAGAFAGVAGCASAPSPRATAYSAELIACVDSAETRAESAACRQAVRCRYRAAEFPDECRGTTP